MTAAKRPANPLILFRSTGLRDGHAGQGGLPHELNLRRGQSVGLVDEVVEGARQFQGFGGEGAGGGDGAGVFVPQPVKAGDGFVSIVITG